MTFESTTPPSAPPPVSFTFEATGTRLIDGSRVALNVAGLINERLPERVPRTTERVLLEVIEHLLPYDRTARCAFQASVPSTGSQAAEMPRPMRIEDINPWSLPATR
jgi:hypothetical protein